MADVAYPLKLSNSFVHGDDEQYFKIPETKSELGLEVLDLADHAPGAYLWLFTNDLKQTVIIAYVATTEPGAVKRLLSATQEKACGFRRIAGDSGCRGRICRNRASL